MRIEPPTLKISQCFSFYWYLFKLVNFAIFKEKHLCWRLFLIKLEAFRPQKESPTQVFSSEYWEIFKNTYFEEHLRAAASVCLFFVIDIILRLPSRNLVTIMIYGIWFCILYSYFLLTHWHPEQHICCQILLKNICCRFF